MGKTVLGAASGRTRDRGHSFSKCGPRTVRGFEKSGVKLYSLSETNPRETRFGSKYREVRETEGSRNRDSTVIQIEAISFLMTQFTQKAL